MTVLITGITGFVGGHLSRALRADGIEVVGVSRSTTNSRHADRVYTGDVTDREFVFQVVGKVSPTIIYHFAGDKSRAGDFTEIRGAFHQNLIGTLNLVEASINTSCLERFLSLGTCEEYGSVGPPFRESMRESPVNAYSVSKTSVTHLLQMLYRTHQFPAVVLRPSLVYGPAQGTDMFLPALIQSLLAGRRFAMSPGDQSRDYIYIDDLVGALRLASEIPEAVGKVINISSGAPVPLQQVARLAAEKIGPGAEDLLGVGLMEYRPFEIMQSYALNELAERTLGWLPTTSLADGLAATVEHFRSPSPVGEEV